jgi:hypothetical protein
MSAPLASGELPPPAPIVDLTGNATKPHPERIARKFTIAIALKSYSMFLKLK